MPSLPRSSSTLERVQEGDKKTNAMVYLNVYDLTPANNYLYVFGVGIFHSGIEGYKMESCVPTLGFISMKQLCQISAMADSAGRYFDSCHEKFVKGWQLCIWWLKWLIWLSTMVLPSAIDNTVHGMEYGFGAHEYPTSGVFEVEPRSCPGFIFRRTVMLGTTDMSYSQFRSFIERLSAKYHGDSYHLIAKNCNHFTDEVCQQLTGKPIPAWVNRLARVGSFCNCLLPESLQVEAVRHEPDHIPHSADEEGSESDDISASSDSDEEDSKHHLLNSQNADVSFIKEKPIALQ